MTVRILTLGINNYRAPIPSLLCCERDARDLTGVFKEGFGFDAQYLEERKTEDVVQRIEGLGKRLKPGDTFVFYFSGHGKAHKDDHYLLLPGAQLEAFESGAVVGIGVLSYRHLKFLTSGPDWKGVHRLFIIDACRAPLVQAKAGELPVCDAEYLLRLPRPAADAFADPSDEGLTLLNSCALGACAVELPEKGQDPSDTGHGLFTASLLELLRKARGSTRDLVIDKSFAGALGESMAGLAKKSRLPEAVMHQPVLLGEGVRLVADRVVEEVEDDEIEWELAKAEGTIEALKAYVRRKPPGKYLKDALALIATLSAPPAPKSGLELAISEPSSIAELLPLFDADTSVQLATQTSTTVVDAKPKSALDPQAAWPFPVETVEPPNQFQASDEYVPDSRLSDFLKRESAFYWGENGVHESIFVALPCLVGFIVTIAALWNVGSVYLVILASVAVVGLGLGSGLPVLGYVFQSSLLRGLFFTRSFEVKRAGLSAEVGRWDIVDYPGRATCLVKAFPNKRTARLIPHAAYASQTSLLDKAIASESVRRKRFIVSFVIWALIYCAFVVSGRGTTYGQDIIKSLDSLVASKISIWRFGNDSNATDVQYKPLSTFRDKFSDGALGPEMVVIPAGSYQMGSTQEDWAQAMKEGVWDRECPKHDVMIGQAFALGKTEVTQAQWRQVMGKVPSDLKVKGCDDCPVESVNWSDVQIFIKKLNGMTGKQYRLPSEAEWEYAAKAGGDYKYAGGEDVDAVAWYDKNSGSQTRPTGHQVGKKKANKWGLYDMSGGVFEWVEDCWNMDYEGNQPESEKARTSGECGNRMMRGGSWDFPMTIARSAGRYSADLALRDDSVGFRLARTLP